MISVKCCSGIATFLGLSCCAGMEIMKLMTPEIAVVAIGIGNYCD